MEARELINRLSAVPPNTKIYVGFEDCGIDDVENVDVIMVERFRHKSSTCGDHGNIFTIDPIKYTIDGHEINVLNFIKENQNCSLGVLIF